MGYMMVIQWDSMGFDGIYDGIASGFYTTSELENGYRKCVERSHQTWWIFP
jgi:hypothetical protein